MSWGCFHKLNPNHYSNLAIGVSKLGMPISDGNLKKIWQMIDENGQGTVDLKQMADVILKMPLLTGGDDESKESRARVEAMRRIIIINERITIINEVNPN